MEKLNHSYTVDETVQLYSYSGKSTAMSYKPKSKIQELNSRAFISEK